MWKTIQYENHHTTKNIRWRRRDILDDALLDVVCRGVPLDGGRGIWIPKKDEKLSTKQRKSAKSLHFAFYFCIFAFRKLEG